ncbi:MAG: hypothetical protein ACTSPY_17825 [Candidatus Helarchaeota archaeon]
MKISNAVADFMHPIFTAVKAETSITIHYISLKNALEHVLIPKMEYFQFLSN